MSSSFGKIGITFASLSLSGNIPVSSDWLIQIVKLSLISFCIDLRTDDNRHAHSFFLSLGC